MSCAAKKLKVKGSGFYIAALTPDHSDQHRFTSWQTTGKNDAWSSALITAYDELAPSQAALQLV